MVRAETAPAPKTQGIAASLLNGFAVLEAFSIAEPELGVTEIAERVGLHKSTVSRILHGMSESRYVSRDPDSGKYRLGMGLVSLAGPLLANLNVRQVAHEPLQQATEQTKETSALSVFNGRFPVVVEQIDSPQFVKHTQYIGTRYNRWASSSFQMSMANLTPETVRDVLASGEIKGAPPVESDADWESVLAQLRAVRAANVSINDGETNPEEFGVSAPVRDYDGVMQGVVTMSAPHMRAVGEHRQLIIDTVIETAALISHRLGYVPG